MGANCKFETPNLSGNGASKIIESHLLTWNFQTCNSDIRMSVFKRSMTFKLWFWRERQIKYRPIHSPSIFRILREIFKMTPQQVTLIDKVTLLANQSLSRSQRLALNFLWFSFMALKIIQSNFDCQGFLIDKILVTRTIDWGRNNFSISFYSEPELRIITLNIIF